MNSLEKLKSITTFVFDVDGVLTNGSLLLLDDGQMARQMNIRDGYALQLAIKKGYRVLVISGGSSEAVRTRLNRLGVIDVFLPVDNKSEVFMEYMNKHQLKKEEILFMGDDMPDLEVMQLAGLPCCPADAASDIMAISVYISPASGGMGCVRDVIEKVMKLNGHWDERSGIAAR